MKYCDIGGQAVLEGVMMKSKAGVALAVRTPDGQISLEKQKKAPSERAKKISKIPIVRGAVNLVLTMIEGVKILMHSAELAGEEEDSWKSAFEKAGYQVECVLKGLGELEAIQQIFVEHAQAAMDTLQ